MKQQTKLDLQLYPFIYRNDKGNPKFWANVIYQTKRKYQLRTQLKHNH